MIRRALFASILALAVAGGASAQKIPAPKPELNAAKLPAGEYKLDKTHASVTLKLAHMGLSHYTLRFTGIDAALTFDAAHPVASKLDVTIDPKSIDTHDAKFDEEIATQFLDADKHPTIKFVAKSAKLTGKTTGEVVGDLTFHGVTKPQTLKVPFNGGLKGMRGEQRLGFSATTVVKRSDFGADKYVALVGDDVTLLIETEFTK